MDITLEKNSPICLESDPSLKPSKEELDDLIRLIQTDLPSQEELFKLIMTTIDLQVFSNSIEETDTFEIKAENVKNQVTLLDQAVNYLLDFMGYCQTLEERYDVEINY